jgi:NTP pyrophosphatase (non-canonical NTP hydrolase)
LTAEAVNVDEDFKELIESTNPEDYEEVVTLLSKYNKPKYNKLKLCEELSELSEVLLKSITKIPEKQPPLESIVEEAGDVILRLVVYIEQIGAGELIEKRLTEKASKLYKYIAEGKYPRGV